MSDAVDPLVIPIDATQVTAGTGALNELSGASAAAEQQMNKMAAAGAFTTDSMDSSRAASLKAADAFRMQGQEIGGASAEVQKILARYDPLGTKLRQLQTDFANLDKAIQANATGGTGDMALDKTMAALNAEIGKTKGLMDIAGVGAKGMADNIDLTGFATQRATRHLMMLGREAMSGEFSRMPSSFAGLLMHAHLTAEAFFGLILPIVAVAGAAAAVAVAYAQNAKEAKAMNEAIASTSDYAGLTRGQMVQLAQAVSTAGTITVGTSKDIVTALVASGRIGADAIESVAMFAEAFAERTGNSIAKIAPELVKLFEDPAKGLEHLNATFHAIDPTFIAYVKHLEDIGRLQEAQKLSADKLLEVYPKHEVSITALGRAWDTALQKMSSYWQKLKESLPGTTVAPEQQLQNQGQYVADLLAAQGKGYTPGKQIITREMIDNATAEYNKLLAIVNVEQQHNKVASDAAAENATRNRTAAIITQASALTGIAAIENKLTLARAYDATILDATVRAQMTEGQQADQIALQKQQQQTAITHLLKEERDARLGMGAEGKAMNDAAIADELKIAEQKNKDTVAEIDFQAKIGTITAAVAAQKKEDAALELNNAHILSVEETLAYGNMKAAQVVTKQNELDLLVTQSGSLVVQGQRNVALAKYKDLDAQIAAQGKEYDAEQKALGVEKDKQDKQGTDFNDKAIALNVHAKEQLALLQMATGERKAQSDLDKLAADYAIASKGLKGDALADVTATYNTEKDKLIVLGQQITAQTAINEIQKKQTEESKKLVNTIEGDLHRGFDKMFTSASGGWQAMITDMAASFKKVVADAVYAAFAKPFFLQIIASVAGAIGATGVAQAATSALSATGSGMNILSGGNTIYNIASGNGSFLSSIFGGGGGTAAANTVGSALAEGGIMTAAPVFDAAGTMLEPAIYSTVASEAVSTGLTSTLAAVPVYGWIAAAVVGAYLMFGRGSTTVQGSGSATISTNDIVTQQTGQLHGGFDPTSVMNLATQSVQEFGNIVRTLGGTIGQAFGLGIGQGGGGEYNVVADIGGKQLADKAGLDSAGAQLAAVQAIIVGLQQAADFPAYIKHVFDALDAGTATSADLQNALAFASTLKGLHDTLTETRPAFQIVTDAVRDMQLKLGTGIITSQTDFNTKFLAAIDAGMTPATLANWQQLATLIDTVNVAIAATVAQKQSLITHFQTPQQNQNDAWATIQATFLKDNVPASVTSGATLIAFVNSLNATDPAAQKVIADLTALVPAMDLLHAKDVAIATERQTLMDQYDSLTMTNLQLLEKERAAVDDSNKGLWDAVQVLTAHKAALATNAGLQDQLDVLTGARTQAQVDWDNQLATATSQLGITTDKTTIVLMMQVHAQQVAAAAAADAAKVTNDRLSLLAQIYALTGNAAGAAAVLEQQHAIALAALDPALRDLQTQLWGLQAAASYAADSAAIWAATYAASQQAAADRAAAAAAAADQAAKDAATLAATNAGWQDQLDLLTGAKTQRQITIAHDLAGVTDASTIALINQVHVQQDLATALAATQKAQQTYLQGLVTFGKSIQDFLHSLDIGSTSTPKQQFDAAQTQYLADLQKSRAGDAAAQGQLAADAQTYIDKTQQMYASGGPTQAIIDQIKADLGGLDAVTQYDANIAALQKLTDAINGLTTVLQPGAVPGGIPGGVPGPVTATGASWTSGGSGITSADLAALRGDVQKLTAVVAAGDNANVQATTQVTQSQKDAAWRAEVQPVVK